MRYSFQGLLLLAICAVASAEGAEVRDLTAKLKSPDSDVRRSAAKELGDLGTEAKDAVPELTRALKDRDLFVRRFVAEALGKIGPDARSAIPGLTMAMNDERKEVQIAAVESLGKIGPESIPALTIAIKDLNKDALVRKKATQALATMGPRARGAVPVLTDILSGKIQSPKANKKNKNFNDDDFRVDVAVALGALARPEDKSAISALKSVSEGKQRNKALKKAASQSLRQINDNKKQTD
ncbi:MAG: HEAT repeat domain-containing protein [Gemmataceae bacterium]